MAFEMLFSCLIVCMLSDFDSSEGKTAENNLGHVSFQSSWGKNPEMWPH